MDIQTKAWKVGTVAGVLLAVFLLALSIKEFKGIFGVGHDGYPQINMISVSGKGEEVVVPDVATFSFSVTETAKTVGDAQTKATEKTNAALAAVRSEGVADKDIKTTSYNINPHYEYVQGVCTSTGCNPGKSVLTGYEVSQTIEVKVRDLSKAGKLFETVGTLGVQNVNSLAFSIDDIDGVKEKAQAKAIADAREKAKKLAKSLDVRLGDITSFSDMSDQPYPYMYAMADKAVSMSAGVRAPAPEIPQGEQKVTSTVSITYEIK